MSNHATLFNDVSLLVTHYNRSASLERLLNSFKENEIHFSEIVVSDDGSKPEHLDRLKTLKKEMNFRLITTDRNRGLGNNINKGQKAVKNPYTLYVQEDFTPTKKFLQSLKDGLSILKQEKTIDLVRFYSYRKHPYLRPFRDGFSFMEFHFWRPNHLQFYCYSDHPHLRRSNFLEKFGNYAEGLHVETTEFKMCIKYLQKKGCSIIYDDYRALFEQKNSAEEPGAYRRNFRKYRQTSNNVFVKIARSLYRFIKFRTEYLFARS